MRPVPVILPPDGHMTHVKDRTGVTDSSSCCSRFNLRDTTNPSRGSMPTDRCDVIAQSIDRSGCWATHDLGQTKSGYRNSYKEGNTAPRVDFSVRPSESRMSF